MPALQGPITEGKRWQRHRRGRHAVLVCPGLWMQDARQPCPYTVVIGSPGDEVHERLAAEAVEKHWTEIHAGMYGDAIRARVAGVLDLGELKARAE